MTTTRRRFLTLSASALAWPALAAAPAQIWRGTAMGAAITLRLEGAGPVQARSFFAEAERALRQTEAAFSLHRESELARLNRTGLLRHPGAAMLALLDLSDRLYVATGGAFDPSVQPLWLARAQGQPEDTARGLVDWRQVSWDKARVRLGRRGMALTFNGVAQGWAADRLAQIAAAHDLADLLIDSGEQRALGARSWQAGVAGPDGVLLRRMVLRDRALATSSAMGTRIGPRGERSHILDPRGARLPHGTVAVSAPRAALADGLSTAFCVMDPAAIRLALTRFHGCQLEILHG
ncbi:FAD:protein FMN transferase [Paracoccus xiamenensis]|uniref:FAD:protein FMN transferase n=1 Tax=Paracoccus xiamenensis TaxID=2714901 RepID=UPI00140E156A|nr:FAD:protein FMN transferase [Paracoccus xiamenensis]NHF73202.1 thiamine biosynthesis protein ApbE [Paracoccus xiamenensis]